MVAQGLARPPHGWPLAHLSPLHGRDITSARASREPPRRLLGHLPPSRGRGALIRAAPRRPSDRKEENGDIADAPSAELTLQARRQTSRGRATFPVLAAAAGILPQRGIAAPPARGRPPACGHCSLLDYTRACPSGRCAQEDEAANGKTPPPATPRSNTQQQQPPEIDNTESAAQAEESAAGNQRPRSRSYPSSPEKNQDPAATVAPRIACRSLIHLTEKKETIRTEPTDQTTPTRHRQTGPIFTSEPTVGPRTQRKKGRIATLRG
jgi:hypothetical protein